MNRLACLTLALGLAVSSTAYADCKSFTRSWAQLYPGRTVDAAHVACVAWPANPKLTIAALPFDKQSADLGVVVADSATGKVVAHGLNEDAIDRSSWRNLERLAIDVTPYPLDKNRTAFGVVAVNRDVDNASRTIEAVMSMYVIDGSRVQPILDRLLVYWRTGGIFYDCAGEVSEVKRKVAVGAGGAAGYPTLNASETSSTYASPHKGQSADDCNVRAVDVKHGDYSIRYRNGRYEVPKALQPFA